MVRNCVSFDLWKLDTSRAKSMAYMFNDGRLAVIYTAAGADLSAAGTRNDMFCNCYSLKGGAVSPKSDL